MHEVPGRGRSLAVTALQRLASEVFEQDSVIVWRAGLGAARRERQTREGVQEFEEQTALRALGVAGLKETHQGGGHARIGLIAQAVQVQEAFQAADHRR